MALENIPRTIWWEDGRVRMIDQSRLPLVGDIVECDTYEGVCFAVQRLVVRGAPALGVAAALAIAAWVTNQSGDIQDNGTFLAELDRVANEIAEARPTAVNLEWGARRMFAVALQNADLPLQELRKLVVQEALNMQAEDEERNRLIGKNGAELLAEESRILTHCNAGSLATAYFGTAVGVIFTAHEQGKIAHVWVDETRPVLQGARLTAWELMVAGVPCALITDNMAAWVMAQGMVDAIIVGADRIAANGDVANKIGTYGLSALAKAHNIPFYVAAPTSTIDLNMAIGGAIPIEERAEEEVTGIAFSSVIESPPAEVATAFGALTENGAYDVPIGRGHQLHIARKGDGYQIDGWARVAPLNVPVYNPAFDITPFENVTAIITERGVARAPFEESLPLMCLGSGGIHEIPTGD